MLFFMLQLCQFSEFVLSLEFEFLRLVFVGFGEELLFEVFFEGR